MPRIPGVRGARGFCWQASSPARKHWMVVPHHAGLFCGFTQDPKCPFTTALHMEPGEHVEQRNTGSGSGQFPSDLMGGFQQFMMGQPVSRKLRTETNLNLIVDGSQI
ncbi:uncharacterized protein AAGF69_004880 isoform 1-T1 [Amazona ochrocephala]